ncbi:MAG: metallophosphoesterase, partial [Armatimonadetes bacterium]|nr:metallophosphoesterase [Armatimonadota bacterium]
LHSGDLTEGAPGAGGLAEMQWALETVRDGAGCPMALARGNHDQRRCYEEIARPYLTGQFGAEDDPYTVDLGAARIVVLDSHRCDAARIGIVAERFGDWPGWRILVAHSPAFNVGRPFFRDRPFDTLLLRHARELRLHVLFCGHTHNSAVVSYDTGGWPLLQVNLSSVRWGDDPPVALATAKTWLVPAARQLWAWPGRLENSWPVYALADVDEDRLELELRGVGRGAELAITVHRDGRVVPRSLPPLLPPAAFGLAQIRCGWLCLSLYERPDQPHAVWLGDVLLGEFPTTLPYYHHRTPLSNEALAALRYANVMHLAGPDETMAVGSLAIEVELDDGTRRWTNPSAGIYVVGDAYADWPEPAVVRAATVAGLPGIRLGFG